MVDFQTTCHVKSVFLKPGTRDPYGNSFEQLLNTLWKRAGVNLQFATEECLKL